MDKVFQNMLDVRFSKHVLRLVLIYINLDFKIIFLDRIQVVKTRLDFQIRLLKSPLK